MTPPGAASGPFVGATPPRIAAAAIRSGRAAQHARTYGPATRQADERALLDAEPVGDDGEVVGPVQDAGVQVWCRCPDAGAVDADEAYAPFVCRDAGSVGNLTACPRRAVEPKDCSPVRRTELGEAKTSPILQRDSSFDAGRDQVGAHDRSHLTECVVSSMRPCSARDMRRRRAEGLSCGPICARPDRARHVGPKVLVAVATTAHDPAARHSTASYGVPVRGHLLRRGAQPEPLLHRVFRACSNVDLRAPHARGRGRS